MMEGREQVVKGEADGLPELDDPNRSPTWRYFKTTGAGETGRRG